MSTTQYGRLLNAPAPSQGLAALDRNSLGTTPTTGVAVDYCRDVLGNPLLTAVPRRSVPVPQLPAVRAQPIYYKDLNIQYPINNNDFVLTNIRVINNQILHLFSTTPQSSLRYGERFWEPTFGSGFPFFLFEPCTEGTAYDLEQEIWSSLDTWMRDKIQCNYSATRVRAVIEAQIFDIVVSYFFVIPELAGTAGGMRLEAPALGVPRG